MVKSPKNLADKPIVLVAYVCPSQDQTFPISELLKTAQAVTPAMDRKDASGQNASSRYVYGIKGIADLFGVSKVTAQKYKDGIIKDAVYQSGRKIVVDAAKAMDLFNKSGRAAL